MLSLRPITYRIRRALGLSREKIAAAAVESWEISPAEVRAVPPAIYLPGQIERIARTEFAPLDLFVRALDGHPAEPAPPTMGFRLRDVDLVDGLLYSNGHIMNLRRPTQRLPLLRRLQAHASGALYETWLGNRWFANWLLEDCLSYRLAETAGTPITTAPVPGAHVPRYEELLGMSPLRVGDAHFDELIVFDDYINNSHRMARAHDMRHRLLKGREPSANPGIFLFRGRSGDLRFMENEEEIGRRLETERGFRVMFAEDHSVDELMDACGGARVIAGVEGSQLVHGIAVMPSGGTLLTLQPPDRTTAALKLHTDRWKQHFSMVVGQGQAQSFRIEWDDVARTLDRIDAVTTVGPS